MRLIDHYDADGWGAETSAALLPRQRAALALIQRVASDGDRILDVGCGDGTFLEQVASRLAPATYVGVDYSRYQLAKAARLPYEFHHCDLGEGIPLPDGSMDVVHAAEVIEHLYDPDLMVEECARVLRPGGFLVVSTPNFQAWYNRMLFLAGIQPVFHEASSRSTTVGAGAMRRLKQDTRPVGHLRLFNRTALLDLLRREGFEPTAVRGARFHGVPPVIGWLDGAFCLRPSMASILVVLARKPA